MTTVSRSVELECRSPAAALWPLLSDTERLNREAGLPEIEVRASADGAARYVVKSHLGPLPVEWAEYPFEWVENQRYSVRRVPLKGPIQQLDVSATLEPMEQGTRVRWNMEAQIRTASFTPIAKMALGVASKRIADAIARFDRALADGVDEAIKSSPGVLETALAHAERELRGEVRAALEVHVGRLVEHVRTAPEHGVARMRPFELADQWGVPRREALELHLAAVVAGMLELSWDVVCPSCRTASARMPVLSELGEVGHCDLCDLSFGVELDRAVEASFRPAPAVRPVPDLQFCTGGPAMMPHVIAQLVLEAGATSEMAVPTDEGRYRLFARGGPVANVEVAQGAEAIVRLELSDVLTPASVVVAPGARLLLVEVSDSARHVKLERLEWSSLAATAYEVSTIPGYRQMFSRDVLRPGLGLRIGRAVVLFSDLSASTLLYAREGDAAAFRLVQDHFDLLFGEIAAHSGAVVKTIGDAVMASFVDEASAVRAALAMQRAFPEFREARPASEGVFLKIGIFAGSCYAVTANGVLDFFGQSVNVAARLQGQAQSGEIVVPVALAERVAAEGLLDGTHVSAPYSAELKGVAEPVVAVRIRV